MPYQYIRCGGQTALSTRRKDGALGQCCLSPGLLVITSFHEPASYLAIDAVESAIGKRDVPFVARPRVGCPPVAGGAPGAGAFENAAANAFGGEEAGLAGSQGDAGHAGRSIDRKSTRLNSSH